MIRYGHKKEKKIKSGHLKARGKGLNSRMYLISWNWSIKSKKSFGIPVQCFSIISLKNSFELANIFVSYEIFQSSLKNDLNI